MTQHRRPQPHCFIRGEWCETHQHHVNDGDMACKVGQEEAAKLREILGFEMPFWHLPVTLAVDFHDEPHSQEFKAGSKGKMMGPPEVVRLETTDNWRIIACDLEIPVRFENETHNCSVPLTDLVLLEPKG